jgi:hypothetical protein
MSLFFQRNPPLVGLYCDKGVVSGDVFGRVAILGENVEEAASKVRKNECDYDHRHYFVYGAYPHVVFYFFLARWIPIARLD